MTKPSTLTQAINIRGVIHDFSKPQVMSILNLNQDSFFRGSRVDMDELLKSAETHIKQGADWLDLGAQSSRPGAEEMSLQQELETLVKAIESIKQTFDIKISVDSYRYAVQEACLKAGSEMVNDIGAENKRLDMALLAKQHQVPYVLMHMRGTPKTMQEHCHYADVSKDVVRELSAELKTLREHGVADVIIDPGFGFAKNLEQNHQMLRELGLFQHLDCPLLIGLSRKSMFYKALNLTAEDVLPATLFGNSLALEKGASILRVHDTQETRQVVDIFWKHYRNAIINQ